MLVTSRMLAAGVALALGLCALPASAALYKWTDANGRVVYSDQPPTGANAAKTETIAAPAAAANPNAAKELAQKQADMKKRTSDRAEASAKADKDKAAKDQRAEECTRVAGSVKQLSWGQVVIFRSNEKGEQVPMDEAARQKERARLEGWLKDNCA